MQKLAALVIVVIAAIAGYLFWSGNQPLPNAPEPPATVDAATASAARAHIADLTARSASAAIAIERADNFVTGEQLLELPQHTGEQAGISEVGASAAAQTQAVDLGLIGTTADTSSAALASLNRLRLEELLNDPEQRPGDVFYIHAVDNYDRQGLWGILQRGLTQTFAQGIRLSGQNRTLSTRIPDDADERLADRSSSFLGHILDNKVKETLVYNYRQGLLGQDPNLIQPGQQLLIIRFSEDELIRIYNHFASQ
jgi:hypothetical protein